MSTRIRRALFVDAAPFRQHIHRVLTVCAAHPTTPLRPSPYLLAAHAGVSVRAIEHLLKGRDGRRPAHRIHVDVARSLVNLWPETILQADAEMILAGATRERLTEIRALVWTDATLLHAAAAGELELHPGDLQLTQPWCSRGTAARVQATYDQLSSGRICPTVYPAVNITGVECRGPLSAA